MTQAQKTMKSGVFANVLLNPVMVNNILKINKQAHTRAKATIKNLSPTVVGTKKRTSAPGLLVKQLCENFRLKIDYARDTVHVTEGGGSFCILNDAYFK